MDKNEKEVLDSYRQERKDRIAKQSKQANKKSNSHVKGKAFMGKVAKVLVSVVVIVAVLAASLNYFGVPQRLIKSVTIDGESYSMSELSCYYMQVYNYYAYYAYYYDSYYGEGYGSMFTGYDYNLSPTEQTKTDEDGNTITWDEFFLEEAINEMATMKRYYKLAVEAGIELTEDAEAEIQESIDSIQEQIDSYKTSSTNSQTGNYSVSRYLTLTYGKGVTEKFYKKVLTEQKYVELYQESRQEALEDGYSFDEVEAIYNEDTTVYDVVSFRWYTIDIVEDADDSEEEAEATEEQIAAAEQSAQKFIDTVKSQGDADEKVFKQVVLDTVGEDDENYETYKEEGATLLQKVNMDTLSSNISDDAASWLYEKNEDGSYTRQYGDMKYFVNDDNTTIYILYAVGTPFRDETKPASVRHILVQFPDEEETATAETTSEEAVTGEDETDVADATAAVTEDSTDVADDTASTVSASDKKSCLAEAEEILQMYQDYIDENFDGKADEDYFAELATEYSDDTGSASDGGLIEDMINDDTYVEAFENWVFAEGEYLGEERTAGETAIIETEYGYHIMFFVGEDEYAEWYNTILSELIDEDWDAEQTEFEESFAEDSIQRNETVVGWVKDACLDIIG